MSKRDYYDILGISREASARELKKAYRSLARKYHPDINPAEDAEAMFKLAAEAYEILADTDQRATYDRFGHQGLENQKRGGGGVGAGFESVDDIFAQFNDLFGDVFSFGEQSDEPAQTGKAPTRGKDLRHTLHLNFDEAVSGVQRRFHITRKHTCDGCDGEGAEPGFSAQSCPSCQGSGKIKITQGFFSVSSACSTCDGRGALIERLCEFCEGSGFEEIQKEMKLTVPRGIEDGARLRIRGEGDPGHAGGDAGDLLISIEVEPSDIFEREGIDLHYRAPVSFVHAALGCTLTIPTLDGTHQIDIPAGCQFGATLRLEGKGVRHVKKKLHLGALIVHILPVTPTDLPEDQLALLRQLAEAMGLPLSGRIEPLDVDVKVLFETDSTIDEPEQPHKPDSKSEPAQAKHPSPHTINSLEQMLRQAEQALGGAPDK